MAIGIMVFYSVLTFFIGPFISGFLMKEHPDHYIGGFLLGFTISILLWMKVGRYYIK
jgi:hypothetical protein